LLGAFGMHRHEDAALAELAFVPLSFVFGMPMPIKAPTRPPAVAPTAAPLKAAMIGPAAIKGPSPGMAKAPMPASHPRAANDSPGSSAVRAPSGAFVPFSKAKSRVPALSGSNTEISSLENPAARKWSTIRHAWPSS
jgi:hypothetical protein